MTNSFAAIEVVHQCIAIFAQFPATDRLIRPNQDARHQRLDRLFFGSRLKGAAHLGRTSPSSIPCPLPLPPEWRDTHASQQTNSQMLRNQKNQTCLPKSVVGALHWMEREGMHQVDRGRHACRCQLFVTINQVGIKTRLTRF